MSRIGILGSGTWGTALAIHLAGLSHEVTLWSALPEEIKEMSASLRHPNLPGAVLPETIRFTDDIGTAVTDKDMLVLAVPSIFTRSTACKAAPFVSEGQIVINVAKGIEENTLKFQSDITSEILPGAKVAVLSGPSHAEEVSLGMPTAIVAGAEDRAVALKVQNAFMSPAFRVYASGDIRGMELGGSLKNVIALAAGMSAGLGYGDNTMAALITRGIAELSRLGAAMGCSPDTLHGLAGLGDLIVTCESKHSRNRKFGVLMGQGSTMEEAIREVGQTVEGVYSAKAGKQLADRYGAELPIIAEVNRILFEGKPAREAVQDLMCRERTME